MLLPALLLAPALLLPTGDGDMSQVLQLDPAGCTLDIGLHLRDVEDLPVAANGTVWLADTGDNRSSPDAVALVSVGEGARAPGLHRRTYPDGPHDGGATLPQHDGRPMVVTKVVSGLATTVDRLPEPGPTTLTRTGQVHLGAADIPRGPVGTLGSGPGTGGTVAADGTSAALRAHTCTGAHVWSAPGGDVVSALAGDPVRVPLAGEAIACTPDGALRSGSEGTGGVLPVIRAAASVTRLAEPPPAQTPTTTAPPTTGQPAAGGTGSGLDRWQAAVIAVVVAGAVVWLVGRLRKMGRRR